MSAPSNPSYSIRESCAICSDYRFKIKLELHDMPLANGFDKPDVKLPLTLVECRQCHHLQLQEVVDADLLFEDYAYQAGTGRMQQEQLMQFADSLTSILFQPVHSETLVLDIGCNDGTLLDIIGAPAIGVDPNKPDNVSGLKTYWDMTAAKLVVEGWGKPKVITMTNTLAHLPDLDEAINAVRYALADDGVFVVQVPWARDMILNNQYDTVYHEHQHWFNVTALDMLMPIVKVDYLPDLHGGSLRVFMVKDGPSTGALGYFERLEYQSRDVNLMHQFSAHVSELHAALHRYRSVDAFGASAKGVMLINMTKIADRLGCVYDDTPTKIGKRVPGTDLQIFEGCNASKSDAEVMLITAWNYADVIAKRLRSDGYRGKFLVPFPVPRFL